MPLPKIKKILFFRSAQPMASLYEQALLVIADALVMKMAAESGAPESELFKRQPIWIGLAVIARYLQENKMSKNTSCLIQKLQKFSSALMLPIAILPAPGLILAIGISFNIELLANCAA